MPVDAVNKIIDPLLRSQADSLKSKRIVKI
jgi:hypothetical protein